MKRVHFFIYVALALILPFLANMVANYAGTIMKENDNAALFGLVILSIYFTIGAYIAFYPKLSFIGEHKKLGLRKIKLLACALLLTMDVVSKMYLLYPYIKFDDRFGIWAILAGYLFVDSFEFEKR